MVNSWVPRGDLERKNVWRSVRSRLKVERRVDKWHMPFTDRLLKRCQSWNQYHHQVLRSCISIYRTVIGIFNRPQLEEFNAYRYPNALDVVGSLICKRQRSIVRERTHRSDDMGKGCLCILSLARRNANLLSATHRLGHSSSRLGKPAYTVWYSAFHVRHDKTAFLEWVSRNCHCTGYQALRSRTSSRAVGG